ncbi:MAG: ankyrin repeat domain-containing protein [Pseudomonadota bacterium]
MKSPIDRHRAGAKALKKAFAAGDPAAAARLRAILPERGGSGAMAPKYADFLHVVAVEAGYDSWPKLKFGLEAAAMSRARRAERLRHALYHGQRWAIRRLLEAEPDLAGEALDLQIATYELKAVTAALARDPGLATRPIGPRSPLMHLAFSQFIHHAPARRDAMLALAALLVAHGADVNGRASAGPDTDHRYSPLYAALGHANNMPLAAWLLAQGASPDDEESLYHATELGHHEGLELLFAHGVRTRGTNALPRALDFDDLEAVRLLLDYGADPNGAFSADPDRPADTVPALHQAARRGRGAAFAALLLAHGADPHARWHGHTPYATARIYGNAAFANFLSERGAAPALSPSEAILAACARGRAPGEPLDVDALGAEDRLLLARLASVPGPLAPLQALVAAGFDPNLATETDMTPLMIAGWEGMADRVAFFLTQAPDLTRRNRFGGDALGSVLHGAAYCPYAATRDHIGCARLLLEAGAALPQAYLESCPSEAMLLFLESWADDNAGAG